ncbi:MAG: hypothetical protein WBP13_01975 [Methylophilaceae bacterium]
MHYLNKLPGYKSADASAEWKLFKKLPLVFLVGTAIPASQILYINFANAVLSATQQKTIFICLGFIFSYWFFVGVVFFLCILMMLMKGPAYVADPYDLPQEDKKFEQFPNL